MAVKTALVVDDSKSARIMLSRLVQKNGLEVNMVESGEEAIAYLENSPLPDVIFMDHMMPGMDGLATTREITQNPVTAHIPVLMYTSKEGPEYEEEMLSSGAFAMLGKPAKPDRLAELIQRLNERPVPVVEEPAPVADEAEEIPEVLEPKVQEEVEVTSTPTEAPEAEITQEEIAPVASSSPVEEEEEEMSQELIEEVSSKLIARAIEDALQPISGSLQRLETSIFENQSEIRKLNARQDQNVNHVSQSVLDASLKQTSVQFHNQITAEIKSVRDMIESRSELSPSAIQQIKDVASQTGSEAGTATAEKAAASAAEAVAAKVSAAQAQIQVQQDMQPYVAQAKKANMIAVVSLVVAIGAIVANFL
jgi:CheY-like chemotaxis protein